MNQLLKLDGIMADGDVKLQRKMQVRRVQKYVETLDLLKIKNSMPNNNGGGEREMQSEDKHSNGQKVAPIQERRYNQQQQQSSAADGVVVTTKWETFDSFPALVRVPSTSTSTANNSISPPKFPWEFFD
ncbi:hypothetical protein Goari_022490 [Gossypium aridum]|uniref:BAG domain-containing protein n=1 Tax=Gossypium aridum TaxID=34290 RepID=A0A7J8YQ85_GOSAI|nr:hypothetical protein [Gossypium aridum]